MSKSAVVKSVSYLFLGELATDSWIYYTKFRPNNLGRNYSGYPYLKI
ncbi:hypothetical protein Cylst_6157 [Cylindrospermum stagnale PCC 7417]|uniref:Uncharacterized protein n=1 Tax=Cylindrospermum stagnale PCC 7417 TaxID=56107 RepID=K9X7P6_9NOST|nr:hypothetical protein Cylst_6157 [Cylindrospermum stagnale PCC 7417]